MRLVNNSIYRGVKEAELQNLKDCGVKASILLCDNPTDDTVEGKLSVLPEILDMADQAGIEGGLIDTAMPSWGIGVGAGLRSIYVIKELYGDKGAVGTGIGNVSDTLGWVKGNFSKDVKKATDAAQNAILPMIGCDWIMFGPIEFAEFVFPAVAVTDTYILTAVAELGTRPAEEGKHPLFKLVG